MNLLRKGASLLREEGLVEFLSAILGYARFQLNPYYLWARTTAALLRGELVLSIGDTSTRIVAEDRNSVEGTLRRFQSEQGRLKKIITELDDADVFFDIGANTGLYTCFASEKCSSVYAFEPYPLNVAELEKNVEINSIDNVSVFEVALSDESGTVGFSMEEADDSSYPDPESPGFGRGSITNSEGDIEVSSVRGDDLLSEGSIEQPNLVKIDVEGAEPLVVDGLQTALSDQRCRLVYCEIHNSSSTRGSIQDHGISQEDVLNQFESLGFDEISTSGAGSAPVLRAQRRE